MTSRLKRAVELELDELELDELLELLDELELELDELLELELLDELLELELLEELLDEPGGGSGVPSISQASPRFGQKKKSSWQHLSGGSGSVRNVNGISGSVCSNHSNFASWNLRLSLHCFVGVHCGKESSGRNSSATNLNWPMLLQLSVIGSIANKVSSELFAGYCPAGLILPTQTSSKSPFSVKRLLLFLQNDLAR
jgi:hypothetical protein